MQRVRIGIMGLAGVFLLVVLATAVYSLFGKVTAPGGGNSVETADNSDAPKEPLAELGVTPGNGPADTKAPQPTPAPARKTPTPAH